MIVETDKRESFRGLCGMIIFTSLAAMLLGGGLATRANPRTQSARRKATDVLIAVVLGNESIE